jgi:hypothetical protein
MRDKPKDKDYNTMDEQYNMQDGCYSLTDEYHNIWTRTSMLQMTLREEVREQEHWQSTSAKDTFNRFLYLQQQWDGD